MENLIQSLRKDRGLALKEMKLTPNSSYQYPLWHLVEGMAALPVIKDVHGMFPGAVTQGMLVSRPLNTRDPFWRRYLSHIIRDTNSSAEMLRWYSLHMPCGYPNFTYGGSFDNAEVRNNLMVFVERLTEPESKLVLLCAQVNNSLSSFLSEITANVTCLEFLECDFGPVQPLVFSHDF